MQSPTWKLVFSSSNAGTHAYGPGITDHFLVFTANVHLLVNSEGAVFMAIVDQDDDTGDHLVFDFGRYWFVSTIRRSHDSALTLRAGRSGLVLALANASDMERFERACDQVLPSHVAGSIQPTLEQLGELGIITVPRLIGGFLRGDPVVQDPPAAPVYAPQEVEPVSDGEDEASVSDGEDEASVSDGEDEASVSNGEDEASVSDGEDEASISDGEDEASVYEDATDAVSDRDGHGAHPAFLNDADEMDYDFEELKALVEEAVDAIRAQMDSIEDFEDFVALVEEAVREITERLSS